MRWRVRLASLRTGFIRPDVSEMASQADIENQETLWQRARQSILLIRSICTKSYLLQISRLRNADHPMKHLNRTMHDRLRFGRFR
jgi:hypothetical protein